MLYLGLEFLGQQAGGIKIDGIVHGVHFAHHHELFDHIAGALFQTVGQFTHGDLVRNADLQLGVAGLFQLDALQALKLGFALALLELLALLLAALGKFLLVAACACLAAVVGVLGGSQIVILGVEAVHIHIHGTGVHGAGLTLDFHGFHLCSSLSAGILGQIGQGNGFVAALLGSLTLGLFFGLCLGGGLFLLCRRLFRLLACPECRQIAFGVLLGVGFHQIVHFGLVQTAAGLFGLAAHLGHDLDDLFYRDIQIFRHIVDFIGNRHSIYSSL